MNQLSADGKRSSTCGFEAGSFAQTHLSYTDYMYRTQIKCKTSWLRFSHSGAVEADAPEHSWWEEWVPYTYRVQGRQKLALRSAAFGTWLSVTREGEAWQILRIAVRVR